MPYVLTGVKANLRLTDHGMKNGHKPATISQLYKCNFTPLEPIREAVHITLPDLVTQICLKGISVKSFQQSTSFVLSSLH